MSRITHAAFIVALVLFSALLAAAQAQSPRLATVNIYARTDRVHISAEGNISEMRVDVADEQGEVVFQSGALSGQTTDWKLTNAQGARVASGNYLVTVTFRDASGKLRKRVEQVAVADDEKARAQTLAPNAAQATITGSGTSNRIAKFTGTATIGNSVIIENAGKIGIGTASPASSLTVISTATDSAAILAANQSSGGVGVKGTSKNETGIGVWGVHIATTGVTPAVRGETNSRDGNAVAILGVVNSTTAGDMSAAVKGVNNDTSLLGCGVCGAAVGVWGEQAKNGYGVYGFAPDGVGVYANSNSGTGLYAQSSSGAGVSGNSGSGDGVAGSTTSGRAVSGITGSGTAIYGMSSSGEAGHFDGSVFIGGTLTAANGCMGCSPPSDRTLKANFSTVNPRFILDRLTMIPIQTWNYKSEPAGVRHIGAMAQDFRAAFGFGESEKTLNTVDAQGVTMAAIQGLYQMMLEKDRQIEQQSRQINQLRARVSQLERRGRKRSQRR
jgi:hypothetical protein